MGQWTDFFTGDSDKARAERNQRNTQRRAREGYGGGSRRRDAGYNPNTGLSSLGNERRGYTEQIIAPRDGVMGSMVPGQPETWNYLNSSDPGMQAAARRYQQLGGDMSRVDARQTNADTAKARRNFGSYTEEAANAHALNNGQKDTTGAYMLNGRRVRDGINGIVHDAQTGQPINAATGQPMSRSAINAVINPQRTPAPETVSEAPGGGASGGGSGATGSGGAGPSNTESRTNGRGVTQTGRNLGKINLTPSAGVADFTGPSFPTQPATNQISSPYPNTTPEGLEKVDLGGGSTGFANQNGRIMGLEGDPAGLSYSSNQTPATKAASYQTITPDDPIAASAFGQDWVDQHKGKATSGGSLQQALGDPNSLRFDASKYTPSEGFTPSAGAPSREEMARRSAFLDADNSLAGMRAVKAGLGVESRGQNHYANVGGKLVEMSQDDKNALLNTDMSAVADWKKNWMSSNLKSDSQPSTAQQQVPVPAQAQNPQVEQDSTPNPRAIPGRKHGPGGAFQ